MKALHTHSGCQARMLYIKLGKCAWYMHFWGTFRATCAQLALIWSTWLVFMDALHTYQARQLCMVQACLEMNSSHCITCAKGSLHDCHTLHMKDVFRTSWGQHVCNLKALPMESCRIFLLARTGGGVRDQLGQHVYFAILLQQRRFPELQIWLPRLQGTFLVNGKRCLGLVRKGSMSGSLL